MSDEQDDFLKPLTKEDLPTWTQIAIDAANVLERRLDISVFDKEYQQEIKNFYRFSPVNTKSTNAAAAGGGRSTFK